MIKSFTPLLYVLLFAGCASTSSTYLFSLGNGPEDVYKDSVSFARQSRLIIMPVNIKGDTYRFLFDTGAPMVVSKELAEKLNMKQITSKKVGDSQGKRQRLDYVRIDAMKINQKVFNDLTAIVADLKFAPAIHCLNIDGIIGANMMRMAIWDIDFENEIMYFTNDFGGFKPDTNAYVMPFSTKVTGTPVVNLAVGKDTVKRITFDTGSGSALSINRNRLKKTTIDIAQTSYGYHSQGLFGSVADSNYMMQGSILLDSSTLPLAVLTLGNTRSKDLLGQRFFQDYRVVLNWKESAAYLTPLKHPAPPAFFGLNPFFEEGKMLVGTIVFGSMADSLGVQPGDQIMRVNGISLDSATVDDYCLLTQLWKSENPDITITIKGQKPFRLKKQPLFQDQ